MALTYPGGPFSERIGGELTDRAAFLVDSGSRTGPLDKIVLDNQISKTIWRILLSTLRALADSLGLSITTVSRALDGYDDVSQRTRERVQKAALEAGYRPNPTARRLRKGTSETVALVMPTEAGRFFEPAFAELLAELGGLLAAQRLDLMLLAARPGPDERAVYTRLVEGRRSDACIVVRTREQDERISFLEERGFPFVCHGRTRALSGYAFVDGDGESGFHALTTRLIARGHRRIAHIAAPSAFTFSGLRAAGWRKAMMQAGLVADRLAEAEANEDGGYLAASRLLAAPALPDALVCATDRMAIGAMRALTERGLRAGVDIAVAGHDNISAAAFTDPPLTTMELPIRQVAQSLVEKLVSLIGGSKPADLTHIIQPEQRLRASTGEE